MSDHVEAFRVLKNQISEHVHNIMSLEQQITSLTQHKEELEFLARSLEESIKVLSKEDQQINEVINEN